MVDAYNGIYAGGSGFFEEQDRLSERLDEISYDEALEILEQGNEEGKYSEDNYRSLQRIIRQHYGA